MLFTPTGTFYSKVQFKTEEVVEKVIARNFKVLYSPSDREEWVSMQKVEVQFLHRLWS
jgi:hypothetical protein